MSLSHLLTLLVPILSLCGTTEYYVRPTEPTNTSCPAQPCLTLSQYINDSDNYFTSNTVFKFLPGTHYMDRPLHIEDVHNVSFHYNNGNPHLVAQFPCVQKAVLECAAVYLLNVHNVSFMGISLTVQTPNMSGMVLQNGSNIIVQLNVVCLLMLPPSQIDSRIGVLMYKVDIVEVCLSHVSNCSSGFVLRDISSIRIINSTAMHNAGTFGGTGLFLLNATNATIIDSITTHNEFTGLFAWASADIAVSGVIIMHNGHIGMQIWHTATVSIINTTAMHNGRKGIELVNTTNASVNTSVMYNTHYGMDVVNSTSISILQTTVMHPSQVGVGVGLKNIARINIINTTLVQSGTSKVILMNVTEVGIINTTGLLNGMNLKNFTRIIINMSEDLINSGYVGIQILHTATVSIINTTVLHNGLHGIYLVNTTGISVINTTAMYNSYYGMYMVNSTSVSIINTTVMQNENSGMTLLKTTNVSIINTTALLNDYYGISLKGLTNCSIMNTNVMNNGYDGILLLDTHYVVIINTNITNNKNAGIFSYSTAVCSVINLAVVDNGNQGMFLYQTSEFSIVNTTLMQNGWRRVVTTDSGDVLSVADPTTLPGVIVLFGSSVNISGCNVTNSNVSAIKAHASNIRASGDVIISNNRAITGAAFILAQNSVLKLAENAHIEIMNNRAVNTGGAFYIDSCEHDYNFVSTIFSLSLVARYSCFFNMEGNRSQIVFTFENNTAGKGGDVLYGGHVGYSWDGHWNCLLSFKKISNISQNGLSLITSDPSRVCLCNGTGQPDCLIVADPTSHSIYPGQSITVSAVVVGQESGTVSGSVHAQFLQNVATGGSPQLESGQRVQGVTQRKCNDLVYTIFAPGDMSEVVLILTVNNEKVSQFVTIEQYDYYKEQVLRILSGDTSVLNSFKYSHFPVYVNFSFLPCPAGFMLTMKSPFKCGCSQVLQRVQEVKCHIQNKTISRSGLIWVGTLEEDNRTVVVSQYCLLDYCNEGYRCVTLGDPDSQCKHNHSGILCGGCQPGLSVALGSAQCLSCSNKYLALLIPFALSGPALVFFIKILDLTISQGTINGLIFYANIVKANEYILFPNGQANPLTIFISWLNLDLGVETCFFSGLTAYSKTWLQFVFPIYIWSIAGLIIILAKYSDRVAKVMGNNSVPVLATIILLSYAKLFRTIITALSYTMLYSSQGHKAVWSADGNVDYLGPKHAPLFAVAVAALLFLWLPYTLLLFLKQWLHKCNCQLIEHILLKLKPFLDVHYGPLNEKHCYWFGALLILRALILLMSALIPVNHSVILNFCVSVSAIVLLYLGLIVYRNVFVAAFDASFFMNLAVLSVAYFLTTIVDGDQSVVAYTLTGIAFIELLGLIMFKLISILRRSTKVMACLHKGQPAEDDWELYEEAALHREIVSDPEEEDSDAFGSIESLPTY